MARSSSLEKAFRGRELRDFAPAVFVTLAVLLGGASAAGMLANAFLQLLALGLLLWIAADPLMRPHAVLGRPMAALLLLLIGWVLLTLVPLPAGLWSATPGRGFLIADYRILGIAAPARPLGLDPDRAIASVLSLLPFVAGLALALTATDKGRETALMALAVVASLSIVVGAMQIAGGADSSWYLYRITNRGAAVGFMSNSNHLATLFLMVLPMLAALAARARTASRSRRKASLFWPLVGTFAFVTFGLLLNGSAAGLLLLIPSVAGSAILYLRGIGRPVPGKRAALAAGVVVLVLVVLVAGPLQPYLLERSIAEGATNTTRSTSMLLTWRAAVDFLPFGSGLGSFRWLYTRYEDPSAITSEYVNHAHNDYLELLLELGLVGAVLIVGALALYAWRSRTVWSGNAAQGSMARGASVALGLLLLHSIVDYPARTATIAAVAGLFAGLLLAPNPRRVRRDRTLPAAENVTTASAMAPEERRARRHKAG